MVYAHGRFFIGFIRESKISYGIIDPAYSDDVRIPKNLIGVVFRIEQGAFLAFYISAKKSVSGKIGFIGKVKGNMVDALYLVASEYLENNNTWEGRKIVQMGLDSVVGLSNANKFEYIKIIERKIVNEEIIVSDSEYAFDLFKSKL
uniref:BMP family ABC transporter substrate-binding protein n=1 Tax=Borreliella garinii TaxID=29519 RepID=UPI0027E4EF3F|nr:BMP family ABC transporter substrate-binding protein [Borreliella garinii]